MYPVVETVCEKGIPSIVSWEIESGSMEMHLLDALFSLIVKCVLELRRLVSYSSLVMLPRLAPCFISLCILILPFFSRIDAFDTMSDSYRAPSLPNTE